MKILKHGKRYKENSIIKCVTCECEFEYDSEDIIEEISTVFLSFDNSGSHKIYRPQSISYILCPECGSRYDIIIKQ